MKNTALLLIDIQKGLDNWEYYGGNRNNSEAEHNASQILSRFRLLKLPIYHIRHSSTNTASPLHASKPGFELKDEVAPILEEPVLTKNVNSAFIGTHLDQLLKQKEINTLVVCGLTTNHCVSTSVRMGANLGFDILLVSDACATFNCIGVNGEVFDSELMHQTTLASLKEEFAQICSTGDILNRFQLF